MTHEKARELFSAYHEGTLDKGLATAFEQKLDSDAKLASEYAQFADCLDGLADLKVVNIPVPADLGERIQSRLDKHIWDAKQNAKPAWMDLLKNFGFVAAAGAVLVVSVLTLRSRGSGPAESGIVPMASGHDQVKLVQTDTGVRIRFAPSRAKNLTIYQEPQHQVIATYRVDGTMDSPLENPNSKAELIRIEVQGAKESFLVALPGKTHTPTDQASKQNSTVEDLATALAGWYGVPIQLQVSDLNKPAHWNFKETTPVSAAMKALEGEGFTVDQRESGLTCIQSNN